jgi:peptidoglycan/LPS O-acetylase OafA/YrhL
MTHLPDIVRSSAIPLEAGRGYIPGFDGLRALAVLVVMVAHMGWESLIPGGFGVTVFFFLSGFLITRLLVAEFEPSGRIGLGGFWARRLARLAPPLLVFLLVSGVALWALGVPPTAGQVLAALFYAMNYWKLLTPDPAGGELLAPWGHLWSLAVEEHFYLLFPVLLLLAGRSQTRRIALLAAVIVGCAVWRTVLVYGLGVSEDWAAEATDARIDSIAWGCLLAVMLDGIGRAVRRGEAPRTVRLDLLRSWTWLGLAVILILFTLMFREIEYRATWRYSMQGFALFVLVLNLYTLAATRPVIGWLECAPLRWTGRLSYALYLWHLPVVWFLFQHEGGGAPLSLPATLIAFITSFALALASWSLVERPSWRLRARFGGMPVERLAQTAPALR